MNQSYRRPVAVMSAMLAVAIATSSVWADTPAVDKDFATKAAQAGIAEVAEARLALKNSTRPDVQNFARRMIADHTKAGDQLKSIASSQGLALPGDPSPEDQQAMTKLGSLSGEDFDRAYIESQVSAHEAAVGLFTQESEQGKDAQFRSFASSTLPTLKDHYQMIKSLPVH
jgi:putative membrane protein